MNLSVHTFISIPCSQIAQWRGSKLPQLRWIKSDACDLCPFQEEHKVWLTGAFPSTSSRNVSNETHLITYKIKIEKYSPLPHNVIRLWKLMSNENALETLPEQMAFFGIFIEFRLINKYGQPGLTRNLHIILPVSDLI